METGRSPILALVLYCLTICDGANILYLSGMPSPSHGLWNLKLSGALADRGHNVTVLTCDLPKKPLKNVHIIEMTETYKLLYGNEDIGLDVFVTMGLFEEAKFLYDFMIKTCEASSQTDGFKQLLQYPNDFHVDLIINDFTISSCLLGFLHKFNYPPLISVSPYKYATSFAERVGGHQYAGYIPRPRFPFSANMTLIQRVQNVAVTVYERIYRRFVFQPKYDKLIASIFQQDNIPSSYKLDQKAALVLLNIHPTIDFPIPLPPNVIPVGGLQISDPQKLPPEIENFMQSAKNGVILISFGTNVNANLFNEKNQQIVVDVVRLFPGYHFLWKFEKDPSDGKVTNLMVKTWLPQNDILAHPTTIAFVSHAGGLSTQEATSYGVPIVAVPFFMDQLANANSAMLNGVGVVVGIQQFTARDFEAAIRKILFDKSYFERAKLQSFRFKTRPMKPLEAAVWWIEYVLEDPNPNHLRPPVFEVGEFQANSYDLLLYGVLLLVFCVFMIQYLCKLSLRWIRRSFSNQKHKLS